MCRIYYLYLYNLKGTADGSNLSISNNLYPYYNSVQYKLEPCLNKTLMSLSVILKIVRNELRRFKNPAIFSVFMIQFCRKKLWENLIKLENLPSC